MVRGGCFEPFFLTTGFLEKRLEKSTNHDHLKPIQWGYIDVSYPTVQGGEDVVPTYVRKQLDT